MAGELDGKVVIVTGGAAGIGQATAERFVAEGAQVVIGDVDAERGEQVAADLGDAAAFQRTDVSGPTRSRRWSTPRSSGSATLMSCSTTPASARP